MPWCHADGLDDTDVTHDNVYAGDIIVCCAQYNGSAGKNGIYCSVRQRI